MAQQDIPTLKETFSDNKEPNGQDFGNLIDSFEHKSIPIAQTRILGLDQTLDKKADKSQLEAVAIGLIYKPAVLNAAALTATYPNAEKGWAAKVEDQKDPDGNAYIFQFDGTSWGNTGLIAFPDDVASKKEVDKKADKTIILNVSQLNEKYNYTDNLTARNAVPVQLRGLGQQITYQLATGDWIVEQFIGNNISDWAVSENWRNVGGIDDALVGVSDSSETNINLSPYMVTSGYFISENGAKTPVSDSVTRKFVYRLPVKIVNNVVVLADYPITDPKADPFIRIYVNLADGTYLGSFKKDRLVDNEFLMRWDDEQDCYISFYTEYIDSAKGYNYNISSSIKVTENSVNHKIKFPDGSTYDVKSMDSSFSELTGDVWDGSNKYINLTSDKNLFINTDKSSGYLYVKKGWYDDYKLFMNGKEIQFRGNAVVSYINSNGAIIFFLSDQMLLTGNSELSASGKKFTGNTSEVISSSETGLLTTNAFSMGVKAKISPNGFVAIGRGSTSVRYWDFIFTNYQTNGKIEASMNVNGTTRALASTLELERWCKFVVTYNGTDSISIYVDGVLKQTTATSAISAGGTFNIGSVLNLISRSSEIDDVFVVNKSLSQTEISEMQGLKSPLDSSFKNNVVKYWNFTGDPTIIIPNEPQATFSQKKEAILERGSGIWESGDIANPDVVEDTLGKSGYKYIMNYSGYGTITGDSSPKWRMCLAYSNDLENWVRDPDNPIFSPNANEGYISCNGSIVIHDGLYYHFTKGGKVQIRQVLKYV